MAGRVQRGRAFERRHCAALGQFGDELFDRGDEFVLAVVIDGRPQGPTRAVPIPCCSISYRHSYMGRWTAANPAIDMQGYLHISSAAATHRDARRLSEKEFLRKSREPGTIVLDARSRAKYNELHVVGAINLSFFRHCGRHVTAGDSGRYDANPDLLQQQLP